MDIMGLIILSPPIIKLPIVMYIRKLWNIHWRVLDSQADPFYRQLCQFIGQCWLIYPQLNIDSNSSKCKFRFSNCINNSISCEWSGYQATLPCKSTKVDTNPILQRFEIKWMQMDSLSCSSRLKELFPKQSFETILLFLRITFIDLYELL